MGHFLYCDINVESESVKRRRGEGKVDRQRESIQGQCQPPLQFNSL